MNRERVLVALSILLAVVVVGTVAADSPERRAAQLASTLSIDAS